VVVVVVDSVTGAEDIAAADEVVVGATEAVLIPRLKLGGAADDVAAGIVVVGGMAAVAVGTAEPPRVRPTVVATVPEVEAVGGNENPPMAGAAAVVVVAGAPRPKLKPPVGAVVVPGAADVAAGAPNEKPPAAAVVAVLPSPRDREGVVVGADIPNEGGLAAEALGARAVAGAIAAAGAGAPKAAVKVPCG